MQLRLTLTVPMVALVFSAHPLSFAEAARITVPSLHLKAADGARIDVYWPIDPFSATSCSTATSNRGSSWLIDFGLVVGQDSNFWGEGGAAADERTAGSCGAADGRIALGSPAPPPASGADIMPLPSCCGFLGARWARRESLRSQARVCGPLPILKLAYEAS
jgi:hypothetical protein